MPFLFQLLYLFSSRTVVVLNFCTFVVVVLVRFLLPFFTYARRSEYYKLFSDFRVFSFSAGRRRSSFLVLLKASLSYVFSIHYALMLWSCPLLRPGCRCSLLVIHFSHSASFVVGEIAGVKKNTERWCCTCCIEIVVCSCLTYIMDADVGHKQVTPARK